MGKLLSRIYNKMRRFLRFVVIAILVLIGLGIGFIAYGIDGDHIQGYLDEAIPQTIGRLTIHHLAFRPGRGLVMEGVAYRNAEGKLIAHCAKGIIGVRLFSRASWSDRITSIRLDNLFVAQIEHDPNEPEDTLDGDHPPFPDLSGVKLPHFEQIPLVLNDPDVLEVRLKRVTGILTTRKGVLHFRDLKGDVDGHSQHVDAFVDVDIHGGIVTARIHGVIFQTRVNGVYRALDFPIIEHYSNNFTLQKPAWADCSFTVGFDKYRNIFDLSVQVSAQQGSYCGIPFDEAIGTIRCKGIWDAVTTIEPIVVRRKGAVVATGKLRFDCPNDRFTFEADGSGLSPKEALQLIDMPFTDAIPSMTAEAPPAIRIRGSIPLLTEQTPSKVQLTGEVVSDTPYTFDKLRFQSIHADLKMKDGVFHLNNVDATYPLGGTMKGDVAIAIPDTAEYTDITLNTNLKQVSLSDLLQPFGFNSLTNCVATGEANLSVRTDETFKESLQAAFNLIIDGGLIGRIPLFAGFTDIMADSIPGISTITDTSIVKLNGTATNGIFNLPQFSLSGGLFMIEGPVVYDLPKDQLNATVIAGIFKKDTLIGNLTRWATVPMTKLLWQLHVVGPIANPKWHNRTIVDKIWEKVPFTGGSSSSKD